MRSQLVAEQQTRAVLEEQYSTDTQVGHKLAVLKAQGSSTERHVGQNFQKTLPRTVSATTRGSQLLVVHSNRSLQLATARGSHPLVGISNHSWFATTRGIS